MMDQQSLQQSAKPHLNGILCRVNVFVRCLNRDKNRTFYVRDCYGLIFIIYISYYFVAIECRPLTTRTDILLSTSASTFGTIVYYGCTEDELVLKLNAVECTGDGTWDKELAVCQGNS